MSKVNKSELLLAQVISTITNPVIVLLLCYFLPLQLEKNPDYGAYNLILLVGGVPPVIYYLYTLFRHIKKFSPRMVS